MRSTGPSVSEKRIDALPKIKREGEETAMSEFLSANLPYLLSGISVGGQYALIAIGYPDIHPDAPGRKSVDELLTYR